MSAIRKMLNKDNHCPYQMIQIKLNIRAITIHKNINEELYMKKLICCWVLHALTEHQKAECVRVCKETLKLLNDGGHILTSKIITVDEKHMLFLDFSTNQESKAQVSEDDLQTNNSKKTPSNEKK